MNRLWLLAQAGQRILTLQRRIYGITFDEYCEKMCIVGFFKEEFRKSIGDKNAQKRNSIPYGLRVGQIKLGRYMELKMTFDEFCKINGAVHYWRKEFLPPYYV